MQHTPRSVLRKHTHTHNLEGKFCVCVVFCGDTHPRRHSETEEPIFIFYFFLSASSRLRITSVDIYPPKNQRCAFLKRDTDNYRSDNSSPPSLHPSTPPPLTPSPSCIALCRSCVFTLSDMAETTAQIRAARKIPISTFLTAYRQPQKKK